MSKKKEGSITAFLSLILLLILAIVMTTIEAARANGAKVYAKRALQAAMDSVLSEYYLPLFQEYHLFGLDGSYGTDQMDLEIVSAKLKSYMDYTFHPGKDLYDLWGNPYNYMNLYGINTKEVIVKKPVTLMDYDGEIFVNQVTAYMKYKEISEGIEKFLPVLNDLQEMKKAQAVLEEKQEAEKSLYEIDKRLLSLMRSIDGIHISEKGVKVNRDDTINILSNFVKKIQNETVTQSNVGIFNELVYHSLKSHYINPKLILNATAKDIDSLYDNAAKIEEARKHYESLLSINQSTIKDSDELSALRKAISGARDKLENYKQREKELIKSCNNRMKTLQDLVEGSLSAIISSKEVIEELIPLQKEAGLKLRTYEKFLKEYKDELNQEFYESLLDDLAYMEKYKGTGGNETGLSNQYNFMEMKSILTENESILLNVKSDTYFRISSDKESWSGLKTALNNIEKSIKHYNCNNLTFDYSTLTKPADSDSFFSGIKTMLKDGVMGLLVEDINKVSKKELSNLEIPTRIQKVKSKDEPNGFINSVSCIELSGADGFLSQIINDFENEVSGIGSAYNATEEIGKILLLQEYLMEYFNHYDEVSLSDKIRALDYELEYFIMGKSGDYDNLSGVITRILLIRTAMNLIILLSDRNSNEKARILAVSFVGFTGMPALVEVTKMIILTAWSFAESMVDIKALLQGKTFPLMKKSSDIQMNVNEIFIINKDFIKSKAEGIKDSKIASGLSYEGYLKVFLYLEKQSTKSYRAMDLIQENLKLRYEDSFYIKNCVFGFAAEADFTMKSKFINLSFIRKMSDNKDYGYKYHINLEYSY